MSEARFAVATDTWGWHERQLSRAFVEKGADAAFFSLRDCSFAPEGSSMGIRLPGFTERLPAAVFVRCVPGGSFEQVTRYLDILHALALSGVRVINDAQVIERTVDKAMTSFLLGRKGVANAPSWTLEAPEEARKVVRSTLAAGDCLVQKPLFGSRGRGLRLIRSEDDLGAPDDYAGVFYLQKFVGAAVTGGRDWRVFVVDGDPVAAMERRSESWITNRALGARCSRVKPDGEIGELAVDAAAAVGADYAGVDVIAAPDGKLVVLEVNGIPAWRGLQEVSGIDVASLLVSCLMRDGNSRILEAVS